MANKQINGTGKIVAPLVYAVPSTLSSDGLASGQDGVEYVHPALIDILPYYETVEVAVKGSIAVKAAGQKWLPNPDTRDTDVMRYSAYKARAVFYNVTKRTLKGLVGQVFLREPHVKLPKLIELLEKDIDGSGMSLSQLAKRAEQFVLMFGRCGLFTDYPTREGQTSRRDVFNGTVRPTINVYDPRDVRNWRTVTIDGRILLSLVVLAEFHTVKDDGFSTELEVQFRVLRLEQVAPNDWRYSVEIHRPKAKVGQAKVLPKVWPRDGAGLSLREIPFTFIGAETNNASVDSPPLFDLADLNLAHYRNSADYEDSVFMVGQPTPWAAGLTADWVDNQMGGSFNLGSRAVIPLPEGGTCGLLQAEPNTLVKDAMSDKERQMVALGAKLVEQKQVQRTATEASQEEASETSVLSATADNVTDAVKWSLEWCAIFVNAVSIDRDARSKAVEFKLNTEYDMTFLDSAMLTGIGTAWGKGMLTDKEMRDSMGKAGLATDDFEVWETEQAEKMTKAIDDMVAQNEALAAANPDAKSANEPKQSEAE